jgi:hypothetical protein
MNRKLRLFLVGSATTDNGMRKTVVLKTTEPHLQCGRGLGGRSSFSILESLFEVDTDFTQHVLDKHSPDDIEWHNIMLDTVHDHRVREKYIDLSNSLVDRIHVEGTPHSRLFQIELKFSARDDRFYKVLDSLQVKG